MSSIVSLSLTFVLLISHTDAPGRFTWALVEFWVAGVTWIVVLVMLMRGVFGSLATRNDSKYYGKNTFATRDYSFTLAVFTVAVLLLIPLVAPFDPSMQGDLRTTRFLKPLQAACVVVLPSNSMDEYGMENRPFVEQALFSANDRLLHRNETFYLNSTTIGLPGSVYRQIFLLGTDDLARDIFSRLLYGIRMSILIGILSAIVACVLGASVGISAGLGGSILDRLLMRITDLFIAVPSLFLLILLVAFFGNSFSLLIILLAVTGWMNTARLVRGEVLHLKEMEFVKAARLLGTPNMALIQKHILPHLRPTIVSSALLQFCSVLLAEAALGFLGLGIQPPMASLGNMIGASLSYIQQSFWMGFFPGLALVVIVVSLNNFTVNYRCSSVDAV